MLSLQSVSCVFAAPGDDGGSNAATRYVAVQDTQLEVAEGEFVSVVGPTGCGKSTLLNVAAGHSPRSAPLISLRSLA